MDLALLIQSTLAVQTQHALAPVARFVRGQEVGAFATHPAATNATYLGANNSFKPSPLRGLGAGAYD